MKIPTKKLKTGFEMPVFGIGTWTMGGERMRNSENDDEADIRAIKTAIEMGITHIDTAEYLDLYLIHAPNLEIPLEESMEAMDKLKEKGLIKNIGVSNFKVERFKEAQKHTKNKIVVNQVYYGLIVREPERTDLLNYCQTNDVILTAYRPIEKGLLAQKGIKILDYMCQKYAKAPAQIAINWLISQKDVVTLSKTRDKNHLRENIGALGWKMEKEDIEKLRKEFPNQKEKSEILPLL